VSRPNCWVGVAGVCCVKCFGNTAPASGQTVILIMGAEQHPDMEDEVFRCEICGQVAPSGARAKRVVLVSRPKSYVTRGGNEGFQRRFRGPRPPRQEYDKGGKGHEIVREVLACSRCAEQVETRLEAAPQSEMALDGDQIESDVE